MDENLTDALLIVLKAQRDPEWTNWNWSLVAVAEATLTARTNEAIMRRGVLARAQPDELPPAPPDPADWVRRSPSNRRKTHRGRCPDCGTYFEMLERHTNCSGRR
jgi:hypothetical protein